MKEKKTDSEKITVVDIKLTRRRVMVLSCVLVAVGLLAYLTLTGESAVASGETSPAQSTGMRQFYLTTYPISSINASDACAPGYHFASLWELTDPSNLKYNTSLGYELDDSGEGPPSWREGWVRTGYTAESSDTGIPGRANCDGWTTDIVSIKGTRASLPDGWTTGDQDMGVWNVGVISCMDSMTRVWCIED